MRRLILFLLLGMSSCAHRADVTGSASRLSPPVADAVASGWKNRLPKTGGAMPEATAYNYADRDLAHLVDLALERSTNVAEARARIADARARLAAAGARTGPDGSLSGSARSQRQSKNGTLPIARIGLDRDQELYQVGFDASWELDLFGGVRAGVDAADARLGASEAELSTIRLSVATEVLRTWNEFQASRIELEQQRGLLGTLEESLSYVRRRADAGDLSFREVEEWIQRIASARAALSGLEGRVEAARLALATLSGQPAEALNGLMDQPAAFLNLDSPPELTRAEVIGQRPDIVASERRLRAAIADTVVANAQLYPRIALSLNGGWQASELPDLFSTGSVFGSIGPSITWRILERGRVRADIAASSAREGAALRTWEQAVIFAINDVERARSDVATAQTALQERMSAGRAAQQVDAHAARRLVAGDISRIERLEVARIRIEAEQATTRARLQAAQAGLAFDKALGRVSGSK